MFKENVYYAMPFEYKLSSDVLQSAFKLEIFKEVSDSCKLYAFSQQGPHTANKCEPTLALPCLTLTCNFLQRYMKRWFNYFCLNDQGNDSTACQIKDLLL